MSWPAKPLNGQQVTVNGLLYSWNNNNFSAIRKKGFII
jgi:hypothetical protein